MGEGVCCGAAAREAEDVCLTFGFDFGVVGSGLKKPMMGFPFASICIGLAAGETEPGAAAAAGSLGLRGLRAVGVGGGGKTSGISYFLRNSGLTTKNVFRPAWRSFFLGALHDLVLNLKLGRIRELFHELKHNFVNTLRISMR
jgi:hypothetical protein